MSNSYQFVKKMKCVLFLVLLVNTLTINARNSTETSKPNKTVANVDSLSSNSVYKPVMSNSNAKIMNWTISTFQFYKLYLSSLAARYSLFVPTDEYFTKYIDPVAFSKDIQGVLKYWYNSNTAIVNATIYKYDKQTGIVGDSVGVITSSSFLTNRLLDLLNSHIVLGDVKQGKSFYQTRGNNFIKVSGSDINMTIQGGGDMQMNTNAKLTNIFTQANGNTYFIDKPIQAPLSSVYKVLSTTPEFSEFFSLLAGFPAGSSSQIFVSKANNYGVDFNVKFFYTYNYTVYVPTNSAIVSAIQNGIITPWSTINGMTDATAKAAAISKLERFLRYHFQDKSVFVDNQQVNKVYQSSTIKNDDVPSGFNTSKNKFYKIRLNGNGNDLSLSTETGKTAHVVTGNGLYNIMTRDFIFNAKPASFKNIDGTGTGTLFSSSQIVTSSTAVIHQIDDILSFE